MLFLLMLLGCVKELKNEVIYKGKGDLIQAAIEGKKDDIINLLTKGEDINETDADGKTSLYIASQNGNKEVVELLLSEGASIDLGTKNGSTPLYIASHERRKEVVELLLAKGAYIDLADNIGWTPLLVASLQGYMEVVELLLTKGASIDLANKSGRTPLYIANFHKRKGVVELLLEKGAVDLRDEGETIYTFIAKKQKKTSDKFLLIRANLNKLRYIDNKDKSLVCSIFKCDDTELLIFMLETLKEDNIIIQDFLLNIATLAIELKAFNCLKEIFLRIKDKKKIDSLINTEPLTETINLYQMEIISILIEINEANLFRK